MLKTHLALKVQAIGDMDNELTDALRHHQPMHSPHEGFAVLKEEVDELWAEVKKKPEQRSKKLMRAEALQVAAMAIRFVVDLC